MARSSRQVNFFATQEDMRSLVHAILADGTTVVVAHEINEGVPKILDGDELRIQLLSGLNCYLLPRAQIGLIETRGLCATRTHYIDGERSPVIELISGGVRNNRLLRGRAYFIKHDEVKYSWNESEINDVERWAKKTLGVIRKQMTRSGYFYYGFDARSWIAAHHAVPDPGFTEYAIDGKSIIQRQV